MFRNYLKVATRYLLKYKEYSFINILGLAVGTTCCLLIMLFVKSEFSYDRFNSKVDRIVRVWVHEKAEGQDFIDIETPIPMGPAFQNNLSSVEANCRIYNYSSLVKNGDRSFNESVHMVDESFFNIFDFKILKGNQRATFPNANSIVIDADIAQKYFGGTNPIGKTLEIEVGDQRLPFSITAVMENAPQESSIRPHILLPFSNDHYFWNEHVRTGAWSQVFVETYVLFKPEANMNLLQPSVEAMMKKLLGTRYQPGTYNVHLQPMKSIHLDNSLPAGIEPVSNPKYSYILATIGVLILLLACINFVTLSIGRSTTRAMEVGVRKVLGAERKQLIRQFWGEALFLTLISILLGIFFTILSLKGFNQLTGKSLNLHFDFNFIVFCILLAGIIAFIAGIYPAVILSGFNPIEVLKGKLKIGNSSGILRRGLIVGQFVTSIGMIICTIVVGQQLRYLKNKDLGYSKEQIVVVPTNLRRSEGMKLGELYRNALMKHPEVKSVSLDIFSMIQTPWAEIGYTDDNKVYRSFEFNAVDPEFVKTMQIQMVAGRDFSRENPADQTSSILVNETLVKEYGWTEAIGKKLPGRFPQQIVGVMKDFNIESLHTKIRPLVLAMNADSILRLADDVNFSSSSQPRLSVRLSAGNIPSQLQILKNIWQEVAPNQEFEYNFLDQNLEMQYAQEERTASIVKLASALSIFIACMGLFGLVTLSVTRRIKEIGIRKVLGASSGSIVGLLSKEFIRLILVASLIAFPIAWWALDKWLADFAYRVKMEWWVYAASGSLALLIALLTVSFQAIKAAIANPVKTLRTE